MTLRARLTLLFLVAVQVTFLSALASYWGLHRWQLLADDLGAVTEQAHRLGRALAAEPAEARAALDALGRHAQTHDETRRIDAFAAAVTRGTSAQRRLAGRRLRGYYRAELRRLRADAERFSRLSTALIVGVTVSVVVAFLAFLGAIQLWLIAPVRELERATDVMSTGDLTRRIPIRGDDELARLAGSINRMAASLADIQAELVVRERFAFLGELAAYVAHNIRNPLASIRTAAQGELIDMAPDDERRAALEDIVSAADRLASWVGDLLRSASPIHLDRRTGSIGSLVERSLELARPRLAAAGIRLTLAVEPTPAVSFDQAKLDQVVGAVLANAAEASPPGGRISVRVAAEGPQVTLSIADEGPGIPPARRERLFTPFATTKATGTGLGLWLSQRIVTAHGGSMALRDDAGPGTTVEIRLPIREDASCRAS